MGKVKFGDVVKRVNIYVDRFNTERLYYVGKGGSIEPNALDIKPQAKIVGATIGFKFHFGFNPGHILFMSRCFDQHKAATATFAGVCSDSTYVVETRDESVLMQSYLQLVMQTDDFWAWCEEHKSGGVNFLINYGTLETYEFDLPSLDEQKVLADKLWAAYRVKESYRKLLAATDDMVKAKFVEMFFGKEFEKKSISQLIANNFSGEWGEDDIDGTGIKVIKTNNFQNDGTIDSSSFVTRKIEKQKIDKKKLLPGDILLERSGGTKDNPVGRVVYFDLVDDYVANNFVQTLRPNNLVLSKYLFYNLFIYYNTNKIEMRRLGKQTSGIQNLDFHGFMERMVLVPPMELQQQFVDIATQAEATKASLRQSIESIDRVIKSLINQ